ncbi:hypothetical protein [Streptomyces vilmorinianum]|uniref:hypothetical protein n=1 Tax=Streptomyces vilmorinianum TaxID=3051092 RepID=UPI0020C826B4|nr:hypothetical protein [Streptomyces vilmorinianum]
MEATETAPNADSNDNDVPVTEPAAEAAPAAEPVQEEPVQEEPVQEEPVPARRRRGGRAVALIAAAAVLGIVGGTAVGYGIQAEREPTPLPALNQPALAYPKPLPEGQAPKPLPASEDRKAKTDGDLRKLLLPKPAGAQKPEFADADGWMTVPQYVGYFNHPRRALNYQLESRIRRVATTSWRTGTYRTTSIRLVQYRPSDMLGAQDHAENQMDYMPDEDYARSEGDPIKGSANGRYYVFPVKREAGYLDHYQARAYFYRGDIMVEIFISDTKKISKKDISSVAERQLGRL